MSGFFVPSFQYKIQNSPIKEGISFSEIETGCIQTSSLF